MRRSSSRWLLWLAAMGLVIGACGGGTDATTTTAGGSATTEPVEQTTTTALPAETTTTVDEAADYPSQPITWIVAFDPGGGSDIEARRIQDRLQEILGTRIQIEYRSGGGGAVGWSEFVKRPADGYTVAGLVIPHIVIQPLALDDPGYQTEEIRAAAWTVAAPAALIVANDSPYQTLEDFVAAAQENPGGLTVGGVATFSASDLALAEFIDEAGIEVTYVPVTGGAAPLISDLLGGHIDALVLGTSHAVRNSDTLRPLAIAGDERFELLPDTPTFSELGYDVSVSYAWGVGMPAGTPEPIVEKFGNAVIQAMRDTGADQAVIEEGLDPILLGPDQAQAYVDEQVEVYTELLPILQALHGES
ncbi:MAG: hypothetical protein KatS3mg011_2036 [Acidimicrobiia bacterium]|nr:MAG: hypothetical protein KatS3mg011_2036 [Acidimicrobiia bacterium]